MFKSIACNRTNHALDIAEDYMIYAAGPFVALYDTRNTGLSGLKLLRGHTDKVTCLSYIYKELKTSDYFVSGSNDKSVILWKMETQSCNICHVLVGHEAAIAAVTGNRDYIVSSDSKSTVIVWKRNGDAVEIFQKLLVAPQIMTAIAITNLPTSNTPIMLLGGTDKKIHIYILRNNEFNREFSLSGHSDWIKCIKFAVFTDTHDTDYGYSADDLMITTAAQDGYIRIWRLTSSQLFIDNENQSDIYSKLKEMQMNDDGFQLSTKAHSINVNNQTFTIMLDALLVGHDDWVHSINWQPAQEIQGKMHQPMCLISASADKSLIIWKPDPHSESWIPNYRLGEVGGNTLGFYGAVFSMDGSRIFSNGYHGAIHIWGYQDKWTPLIGLSGHGNSVEDVCWDPSGTYLLSVSLDQTSRVFAKWNKDGNSTWHEIARPQIHGYDLHCAAFLNTFEYVSGADEKVLRMFSATKSFAESLKQITGSTSVEDDISSRPIAANLPALGLSNKAVYTESNVSIVDPSAYAPNVSSTIFNEPPFEEDLLQNTLWPEIDKMYGHGFEIMAVACTNNGKYIASSCKSSQSEHAAIRLWSSKTRTEVCKPLTFHSLTVTALAFSNNDKYLVSAGRDRSWCIFDVSNPEKDSECEQVSTCANAHSRIIWDVCFSKDDEMFFTASRDKTIKVWALKGDLLYTLKFEDSVTCIDADYDPATQLHCLAVGLDNGSLLIHKLKVNESRQIESIGVKTIDKKDSHFSTVNSIKWRPNSQCKELATCSSDGSVRVYLASNFE